MSGALFSPIVERAMRLAARHHREGTRKGSDLPYISHPASVALILSQAGFDDDAILAAALLHDVVEDTACTLQQIEEVFPPEVAMYVAALTEKKLDERGAKRSWRVRKEEHVEQIASAPLEARAILLADKLHNLGTMLYDVEAGESIWGRFQAVRQEVLWYHRTMIEQAFQGDERLAALAGACRDVLARLEACVE